MCGEGDPIGRGCGEGAGEGLPGADDEDGGASEDPLTGAETVVGVVLGGGRESGKSPGVEDGGVLLLVLEPGEVAPGATEEGG